MNKLKMICAQCDHSWQAHNTVKNETPFCCMDLSDDPDKEEFCTCMKFMTPEMVKQEKFKFRYVLGEGWFLPYYKKKIGILAGMQGEKGEVVHLNIPPPIHRFQEEKDCPKYRLILERME